MLELSKIRVGKPSLKQLLVGGLGSVIGVAGFIVTVAVYVVETLIRPKKIVSFADLYKISPFELELPAEAVTFPASNSDHMVNGWYIPYPGATTTILVCPGYRSGMADVLGMCAHLWKAGHNVLVFEYYGHGQEVGKPVTLGYREINDFMGAVAYAKERAPHARLGVIAYSMGAAVAIMCSAHCQDVEAIVADSSFATHWSVIDYNVHRVLHLPAAPFTWVADYLLWWRAGYRFDQVAPLRDIGKIAPRPILIIHGGKDSLVDPRDAPLLYEAAGEPKELWIVPEADHCGAYFADRRAYVSRVLSFFEEHLKKSRPRLQLVEGEGTGAMLPRPAERAEEITGLSEAS
ncbi:alpha/beta hydrolase [Thermogemmatispora aurantia]|uniref:Alpha/beta hydrolase n=1 Tax=Thermogemmatispora aurantia TaxID=2045279 RepID=A0A5J4K6E7_9CHLR|nr:alpha/beta hydrolase [Thermogemmatispora aurantia]GER82237.1 alpha/beta hydrolase [Thermogemmatispora aurantia]